MHSSPSKYRAWFASFDRYSFCPIDTRQIRTSRVPDKHSSVDQSLLSSSPSASTSSGGMISRVESRASILIDLHHYRYKLRGVQNVIFYAPPEHAQFYGELLAFPFLDEGIDASDVTVKVLYSKYDAMRLERLVGSRAVGGLILD